MVLVAERFPTRGDPLGDFARTLAGARVEAAAGRRRSIRRVARELAVDYREDDGSAARLLALVRLVVRHPLRSALRSDPAPAAAIHGWRRSRPRRCG